VTHLLASLDHRASSGSTAWHRASALAKLLLAAALVGVAIATPSLRVLAFTHALAWLLVLSCALPPRVIVSAAGYPIAFSALFVLARWDGSVETPVRLLMRPLTAGLVAVWLVGTTPYPDLFAPISRVLPRTLGDSLFLTYRALFALLERADHLWQALKLRGGFSGSHRRRLTVAGEALGTMVVHGFDRSRRLYEAMLLRGHSGRICGCRHYADWTRADGWVAGILVVLAAGATGWWRTP
jgi:cobalt/nickel transport system permease protein